MKQIAIGLLAHVDAGKTTLSEAMLYNSGSIRRLGRVDDRDAFLDTHELERTRGITIFSKQAVLEYGDWRVTLLDTPGHVDFSAEMERTLQVLDAAVLIIGGSDGVQGHTRTLWKLLKKHGLPVFLFVNKMDQESSNKETLMAGLKEMLDDSCIDFTDWGQNSFYEEIALSDERSLEQFLEKGQIDADNLKRLVRERKIFPVFFGSALKLTGIEAFMLKMSNLWTEPVYPEEFGARVFKVARDEQGNRLTYMKVTGGRLEVKSVLPGVGEKINQIRIYSGNRFDTARVLEAGAVCAVTGPETTCPGQGLGREEGITVPVLEPVLHYRMELPEGVDAAAMLPGLRQLEEEEPLLRIVWQEETREIQIQVMGEVQLEILSSVIRERYGVSVSFGEGRIVYKETIAKPAEGVGHYEPLKHYAEVHLYLEPLEPGSGLQFRTEVSEDELNRNWQRLVLTHLQEKTHKGVMSGAAITDMRITLVAGKAHLKHTEGGDFRQATYRALRHGLMRTQSVLLEPCYEFLLEIPDGAVGRAMSDLDRKFAEFTLTRSGQGTAVLTGTLPASEVKNYEREVRAYTGGQGHFTCSLKGYVPCHNTEEVLRQSGYDPDADLENPADSVFCAHGAGFVVNWRDVDSYMHIPFAKERRGRDEADSEEPKNKAGTGNTSSEKWIGTDEVEAILEKTFHANRREENKPRYGYVRKKQKVSQAPVTVTYKGCETRQEYLLVDGYNVIFAWKELKELAQVNIDSARGALQDILCNYQAAAGCELIIVFDAYRVKGHETESVSYHNIHVVYTKEAETADQYIEKFAHEFGKKYRVRVATSDGLEQIIIRGQGCELISARELEEEVKRTGRQIYEEFMQSQKR